MNQEQILTAIRKRQDPVERITGLACMIDDHTAVFAEFCDWANISKDESAVLLVIMADALGGIRKKASSIHETTGEVLKPAISTIPGMAAYGSYTTHESISEQAQSPLSPEAAYDLCPVATDLPATPEGKLGPDVPTDGEAPQSKQH